MPDISANAIDPAALDPGKTVVVATGNAHKLIEIKAILEPAMPGVRFIALGELGDYPDPDETGSTFTENAVIKAMAALDETGLSSAIADDSGLCVDALDGAPGIYSARWAGSHGDDQANNEKLLADLADVPVGGRGAHYHASIVLVRASGEVIEGDGDFFGQIGLEPRGTNGFGYDPLFLPDETPGRTLAELSADEKNAISHRYHALMDLARQLS